MTFFKRDREHISGFQGSCEVDYKWAEKGVLWNDETVLNLDCDSGYTLYSSKFIDLYTKEDTFCHV